jgi:hypothetical protein
MQRKARGRAFRNIVASLALLLAMGEVTAQAQRKNPCALFSTAEIQKLLGVPVEVGEPAAVGTACQWFGKDEKSYAIVSLVEPSYFFDPRGAPGYEAIDGVGKRAYTHPEDRGPGERGWQGMAVTDRATASAVLIGSTATRAGVATLLRQLVGRI